MKRSELTFTLLRVPLDYLAVVVAGVAGFYARFLPYFTNWRPVIFDLQMEQYVRVLVPLGFLWIGVFAIAHLYTTRPLRIASEVTRVVLACSASMALIFAILFFSRTFFESRFIAVASWIFAMVFVSVVRIALRLLQRSLLRLGIGVRSVILIGDARSTHTLQRLFQRFPSLGFKPMATFPEFDHEAEARIYALKARHEIDEVILTDPNTDRQMASRLLAFTDSEHLGFSYSADFFALAGGRSHFHTYAGIPVVEIVKTPLDGWGAIYKRLFDIVVSLILIIITLPLQLIIACLLFLEQPGRVLFSRLPNGTKTMRIGQGAKPFHYFKFRSMIKDAHKFRFDPDFLKQHGNLREGTPLFKLKNDPRVTRVGRILRKFSLDEIPEFYLVLLGRMSLIGPRPHLPEEVEKYSPIQRKVLTIKPGITGMAQVSGRADLDFEDEVRLDIQYIEHWSPWLDLVIFFKTPFVVLFRKGAY